jgi:EAL domain-containing protein (putative c-di-GMP-specific phosphodiesterase class I)
MHISINVSNSLFHGDTLLSVVEPTLSQTGMTPAFLELELTESIVMRNVDASIAMRTTLKAMGVLLSIDDFGTGYSSLSYLHRLPINRLKIDQSFIREILTHSRPPMIVRAIIALAHSLGLFVLAEGVEQEGQRTVLLHEGCDSPADAFAQMLQPVPLREAS